MKQMQSQMSDDDPNFGGVDKPLPTYGGVGTSQSKIAGFANGLTPAQMDEIDDLMIEISRIKFRIEALGASRCYSLALTKLDEARHWLQARNVNAF